MNCYFDGSVGGASDEWLTLSGNIARDETWAMFQKKWESMLRNRYPIAPYMHMTDLLTGNDPFERMAGWTRCKVDQLISDAVSLLAETSDTGRFCVFACAVHLKGRKRLLAEGHNVPDPAVICAENGLVHLLNWYTNHHRLELAHLFYDQNEPFIRSIRRRWLEMVNSKKKVTADLLWGGIANVQPVRMCDTPGIQAADVVAWAYTRRLRNVPGDQWATLADRLIGRTGSPGCLTAIQLDPITEDIMRNKYPKLGQTP